VLRWNQDGASSLKVQPSRSAFDVVTPHFIVVRFLSRIRGLAGIWASFQKSSGIALWVCIDHTYSFPAIYSQRGGKVHEGRRLTHTSFKIIGGNDLAITSFSSVD
jgi:hypothetical protein